MKQAWAVLGILLVVYVGVYRFGRPFLYRTPAGRVAGEPVFRPLVRLQEWLTPREIFRERGTLWQNTNGGWSVDLKTPRPDGTKGISFRVPPAQQKAVEAALFYPVEVELTLEPDAAQPGYRYYTLQKLKTLEYSPW